MVKQSGKSILIVDDEPLTALGHLQTLKQHDFRVYIAHKGEDAVEQLLSGDNIGLVLMDMDLQGHIDGAELAEKLLSIKAVPIIFLTYHKEKSYTEKAERVPNYGYLSKDSSEGMLLEAVNMALQLSEDRQLIEEREKALKRSEHLLAETQKMAHIGSWSLDIERDLLYWSDEVYRILGVRPREFEATYGAFLEAVYPEDRLMVDEAYRDSVQKGKDGYEIEHRVIRRDTGEVRFVHEKCEHQRNGEGEIVQSIGMVQDVTKRRELDELKKEVDRIQKHDIRSPLNGVIGIPQLLMEEDNITDAQREYLQMIIDSGRSILNMTDLTLAIYQIEQGSYEYSKKSFDLLKQLRQCLSDSKSLAKNKNIDVVVSFNGFESEKPDAVTVEGEELFAYSVLANILRNAVEASPPGEPVEIDITRDSDILFVLHNRGVVPEGIRGSFFNKYSTSGKEGGTGIGTYSAKILSEAQGWKIDMETSEERGTTIRLTIPALYYGGGNGYGFKEQ